MALVHNFYSVNKEDINIIAAGFCKGDFHILPKVQDNIDISDGIVRYIIHTLRWVKTRSYANKKDHDGLFYHGGTIIYPEQITLLKKIIEGWITMFENAPDSFLLNQYDKKKRQYQS